MNPKLCLRLEEIINLFDIEAEVVLHFVSHSWVSPSDPDQLIFDQEDVARIQLILDLRDNFGVNDEAIPLILHLVDQLHCFHLELKKP